MQQDRRSILRLGTVLGAAGLPSLANAQPLDSGGEMRWQSAFEPQDAWMDRPGTRHRILFDTTSVDAAGSAIFYAENFYGANKKGYGIEPAALGVIIVLRHFSTPFGYNDSIWAKYGATFADKLKMQGEQAIRATRQNPLLSSATTPKPPAAVKSPGGAHADESVTLASLANKGTRFAVCATATEGLAGMLAKAAGIDAKTLMADLTANLVPGAVMVSAGIVAVNRAQEHGYSFVNVAD